MPETNPRNPVFSPEEGDILHLVDGVYVLVDFHDPLRTSFICSNGAVGAYDYIAGWSRWVSGAIIVQRGSPEIWPWHYDGWLNVPFPDSYKDHVNHMPTLEESAEYLRRRTSEEYQVWRAFGGDLCPQSS